MRLRPKRLIPRSLFARSLLLIVVPLIVLQLVVVLVFFELHLDKITQRLATAAAGETAMIVALLERADGAEAKAEVLAMARSRLGLRMRILPGERLPEGGGPRPEGMLERALDQ